MTREEAMAYFKKSAMRIKGIMAEEDEALKDRFSQTLEATEIAIKALEQEQIDKVFSKTDIDSIIKAVNEGWELRVNEVLDKIRAEIERGKTGLDIEFNGGIDYALSIIDKYKADRSEE